MKRITTIFGIIVLVTIFSANLIGQEKTIKSTSSPDSLEKALIKDLYKARAKVQLHFYRYPKDGGKEYSFWQFVLSVLAGRGSFQDKDFNLNTEERGKAMDLVKQIMRPKKTVLPPKTKKIDMT